MTKSKNNNFRSTAEGYLRGNWLLIVVVVLGILNSLYPSLLVFFPSSILASYFVAQHFKRSFFKTTFSSVVLGFSIILLFVGGFGILFWLLGIHISLVAVYLLAYLIAILISKITHTGPLIKTSGFVDYKDVIGVLVIFIYFAMYGYGAVKHTQRPVDFRVLAIQNISNGVDDLTHFNMFKDGLEANRGLLLGSNDAKYISKVGNISYPKMSHFLATTLGAQTKNTWNSNNSIGFVIAYSIIKNAMFVLGIFIFCRATLELWAKEKVKAKYAISISIPLFMFPLLIFINPFLQEGFFSIWPVIMYLPLFVLFIVDALGGSILTQLTIGLLLSVVMLSWPPIAIPLYIVVGLAIADALIKNRKSSTLYLRSLAIMLTAAVGLTQLYVQLFDKTEKVGASQFNAPGGIPGFAIPYILIFTVLAFIGIYAKFGEDHFGQKLSNDTRSLYACLLGLMVCLSLAIGVMNVIDSGNVQYFYVKTSYIVLILLSIFSIPWLINTIYCHTVPKESTKLDGLSTRVAPFIISSSLVFVAFFAFNFNGSTISYIFNYLVHGSKQISTASAISVIRAETTHPNQLTETINVDNPGETYYLSVLARTMNRFNGCLGVSENLILKNQMSSTNFCNDTGSIRLVVLDNASVKNQITNSRIQNATTRLSDMGVKVTLEYKHIY